MHARSPFVHRLLLFLEEKGVEGVPRFLGVDEQGREMLSFVEGYCPHDGAPQPEGTWSDASLIQVFKMLRRVHDVTAGSELAEQCEVVLYGDPAPRNTIYKDGRPIAFIDWDLARPGRRVRDVAQAVWQWLDLGSLERRDLKEHQRRIPMLVRAYGLENPAELIPEIIAVQSECLEDLQAQLTGEISAVHRRLEDAITAVSRERVWVISNRAALESPLLGPMFPS